MSALSKYQFFPVENEKGRVIQATKVNTDGGVEILLIPELERRLSRGERLTPRRFYTDQE